MILEIIYCNSVWRWKIKSTLLNQIVEENEGSKWREAKYEGTVSSKITDFQGSLQLDILKLQKD